jgi:hypothetical protein
LKKGENAQCEILVQLWNKVIEADKDNLPLSFGQGLERVLRERYAFISTSFGVRNQIQTRLNEEDGCSILEMEGDYVSSNIAFGFRKGFEYKSLINYK